MKSTPKSRKSTPAEVIARRAERGENVSRFFTNTGQMRKPILRKTSGA